MARGGAKRKYWCDCAFKLKKSWRAFPRFEFEKEWEWSASVQVQQIRIKNQNWSKCRSLKLQMTCLSRKCHSRTDLTHLDSTLWRISSVLSAKSAVFFLQICVGAWERQIMPNTTDNWEKIQLNINPPSSWTNSHLCLNLTRVSNTISRWWNIATTDF